MKAHQPPTRGGGGEQAQARRVFTMRWVRARDSIRPTMWHAIRRVSRKVDQLVYRTIEWDQAWLWCSTSFDMARGEICETQGKQLPDGNVCAACLRKVLVGGHSNG